MTNQEWDDCEELSQLRSENKALKEQLAAALAENTKLAEQVVHWISVKDRLPEDDKTIQRCCQDGMEMISVLVCEDGMVTEKLRYRILPLGIPSIDRKRDLKNFAWAYTNGSITHWMPLPEPPKEEQK